MAERNQKINPEFFQSDRNLRFRLFKDKLMFYVTGLCLLLILVPIFGILFEVFINGIIGFTPDVFTKAGGSPLDPNTGLLHAMMGTFYVSVIASFFGIPLGIITGIYLEYYGKGFFSNILRVGIDSMVAIPTIITGIVVFALIVLSMGSFSVLAGGIALAFIMIPIIAKTTEEMIRLVPQLYDEAGYALGLSESQTAFSIVIPLASRGIASGVLLAFARIIGETAPLLFTAFFSQSVPNNILDVSATLTVLIYQYGISPFEAWNRLAWVAALLLMLMNLGVIFITRVIFSENGVRPWTRIAEIIKIAFGGVIGEESAKEE